MSYTTNFFIKAYKANHKGLVPLYLRILLNGMKTEQATPHKIMEHQWDATLQRVINHPAATEINQYLEALKNKYDKAYAQLFVAQEEITLDKLKALTGGKEINKSMGLIAVAMEHNGQFEKLVGSKYSYGSYKNYKTTLSYLKEFILQQYKKRDLPLKEINYRFCELYFQFLLTEKPCHNNGACKHIQRLKKIIHYAVKNGYLSHSNLVRFSVKMNPYQRPKLSWEDVMKLQQLKLKNPTLQKVLDVFLFQCYTGLAYADVKKIAASHIVTGVDNKTWICMKTQILAEIYFAIAMCCIYDLRDSIY